MSRIAGLIAAVAAGAAVAFGVAAPAHADWPYQCPYQYSDYFNPCAGRSAQWQYGLTPGWGTPGHTGPGGTYIPCQDPHGCR